MRSTTSCSGWWTVWRSARGRLVGPANARPAGGRARRRAPRGRAAWPGAGAIACLLAGITSACSGPAADAPADTSSSGEAVPSSSTAATPSTDDRLIIAVRHAEKLEVDPDPALSEAGAARAAALAALLADAGIERVLSTDYVRTRETARPTAEAAGVDVELYDPTDIPGLARTLLDAPERAILVVGHSNTTPALVEALTGEPAEFMPDDEYDRLYRVRVSPDGAVRAEVERF